MSVLKLTGRYERGNVEVARIVLSDVEAYGGESSGLAIWARLVLLNHRERTHVGARELPFANRREDAA